jgi:DNA end-binding protein Ku
MIPVKLYAATEQKDIAFRQVHREDGGRIRFRRFCSIEDIEVPYEDIAKGYELPGGEVVVLTEEDMADLPLPTTRNVEVVQFCPADQVDPIMFNRSYYAEPETAGARAYVLLRDAMEQSGKVAIAKVALRQRESLAVLRVREGVLVLETLLWPDEVRETEFPFLDDDIEVRPQELRMAGSLIDSMTVDFDPDEYHDDYREALQEVVNAKIEGREILQPEPGAEVASQPSSLADALRASLAAAKGGKLSIAAAGADHDADDEEDEGEEEAEQPARRRTAKSGTASKTAAKPKAPAASKTAAKPKTAAASKTAAKPKTAAASKTAARSKPAAKEAEPAARPRKRAG